MKKMLLVLVGLALVLAACGSDTVKTVEPSPIKVTLVATDIAYDQTELKAVAGQPIEITLRNDGSLVHDFSIMELPVSGDVVASEPDEAMADHEGSMAGHNMDAMTELPQVHVAAPANGGLATVTFTPSEPGEYEYFCTVAGHKEVGMVGTLVVSAP